MTLHRRHFIAGLSAGMGAGLGLTSIASAGIARTAGAGLALTSGAKGKKTRRLAGITTWAKDAAPQLILHTATGAHGATLLTLTAATPTPLPAQAVFGLRLGDIPGFAHGVAFWRYAPWKSWTKPMAMRTAADLQADDVQCAYWQYDDGSYGVALPLGGGGFRTTLGAADGHMVTVCRALAQATPSRPLPQLAVGFGPDLYDTMSAVFADAMTALGTPENLRKHKILPEALTWLGWNTRNASHLGQNLTADWVLAQVDTIKAAGVPIRTVVLDDGYFQHSDSRLQSQAPDVKRFPGGFRPVVDALTARGIHHVGVWHAFDAYWNGIDPDSELGRKYAADLFTWTQKPSPTDTSGKTVTYSFLKPDPALLNAYFDSYHAGLKAAGISLIKVDNQLVAERMATNNFPIWDLAKPLHAAINAGASKHFDNALINCMDMTNDAFLNFGTSAVARSVEDYFPYKPGETYDLQEGNAAAHVLQAMYNALYFGEMVFPDFDMFESTNPNAALHASVRAANCAPIYITDKAGEHDVALLKSLVDAEGRTLRADTPLRPTADCLFQVQRPRLFKASSRVGDGALLLLANLADADSVSGEHALSDVTGLPHGDYVVWSHNRATASRAARGDRTQASLPRFGHDLLVVAPVVHGRAVIGLTQKRNSLASVSDVHHDTKTLHLKARDAGTLVIWSATTPASVTADGHSVSFAYSGNLLKIALDSGARAYSLSIGWA